MPSHEPVVIAVYEKLGGRNALGAEIASAADLARVVSHRIPLKALTHVQRSGFFSDTEIQRFIIPARTRRHRQEKKERLTVEESDRATLAPVERKTRARFHRRLSSPRSLCPSRLR